MELEEDWPHRRTVLIALMIIGALTTPDETEDDAAIATSVAVTGEPVTTMAPATTAPATTSTAAPSTTTRPPATTTTAPKLPEGCVAVTGPVGDTIGEGIVITGATEAPPNPYGDQQPRWYYSTADVATWVSDVPPDSDGSEGGLVLPINDTARSKSEAGADVDPNAQIYDGIGDAYPAAAKSRECAKA